MKHQWGKETAPGGKFTIMQMCSISPRPPMDTSYMRPWRQGVIMRDRSQGKDCLLWDGVADSY